ncbi:hypothetical protein QE430_000894 [Microbacterium testaceum]|uniref:hypothetical protein n=1 Tax=Microbacterium TaxID=33882 RepID=UPI0027835D3E|nr:hypothetical protein [Microbacterium testaceum]MDQ1172587.1 hypothetical protein [Microbacterium testaceum]
MTVSDLLALAVSASAPHEHGWITESAHSTSQGRVRYVRCSACGARRVDLEAASVVVPLAMSRISPPAGEVGGHPAR